MLYTIAIAVLATGVTVAALLPVLMRHAKRFGLVDLPGARRVHRHPTPKVGGLAMAFGLLVGYVALPASVRPDPWIAVAAAAMVLIGVIDDSRGLSARFKLGAQALIAALVVAGAGLAIDSLGGVLDGWSGELGLLAAPVAMLGIVSLCNATNMIDGVDGLAGSQLVVSFTGLSAACGLAGNTNGAMLAALPIAALAPFLFLNLRSAGNRAARVFMGDTGSLTLGLLLAIAAIAAVRDPQPVPPVVALWACWLPLVDGLATITRRAWRRQRATRAHMDHLHHLLLARGIDVNGVVAREAALATAGVASALLAWELDVPESLLGAAFVVAFAGHVAWTRFAWKLQHEAPAPRFVAPAIESSIDDAGRPGALTAHLIAPNQSNPGLHKSI